MTDLHPNPALETDSEDFLSTPILGAGFSVHALLQDIVSGGPHNQSHDPVPTIDGYSIEGVVISGPSGSVYRAHESGAAQRTVAVKVLSSTAMSERSLRRLYREIHSLAKLEHPSIARLLGDGATRDGRPYCVIEWIDGLPLHAMVADPKFTQRERVVVMHELADALAHAHAKGILHRDLSPSNVIVRPADAPRRAYLIDFGLARITGDILDSASDGGNDRTREGSPMGTRGYMSPEQLEGSWAKVDARSEVFALGVMLYELLAGQLPWKVRDDLFAQAYGVMLTVAPPRLTSLVPGMSADLSAIVHKCIALEQRDRYQSMAELAADLGHWLAGEPVSARSPTLGESMVRLARRHPLPALLSASLLLALVVLSGLAWTLVRTLRAERDLWQTQARLSLDIGLKLADRSGVVEQRREVLENASRLSALLLERTPNNQEHQRFRAQSLIELSKLVRSCDTDGLKRARALRAEALALLDALVAHGGTAEDRRHRAIALILYGDIEKEDARLDEAQRWYERALEEHRRLAAADPDDLASARQVIFGIERLGHLAELRREFETAESLYRQQLAATEQLSALNPERTELAWDRCLARGHIIHSPLGIHDLDDALHLANESCDDASLLVAADPDSRDYRRLKAASQVAKSSVLRFRGEFPQAHALLSTGIDGLEALAADDSSDLDCLSTLAGALDARARLFAAMGDLETARAAATRATQIARSLLVARPGNPSHEIVARSSQETLEGLREHAEAVTNSSTITEGARDGLSPK